MLQVDSFISPGAATCSAMVYCETAAQAETPKWVHDAETTFNASLEYYFNIVRLLGKNYSLKGNNFPRQLAL